METYEYILGVIVLFVVFWVAPPYVERYNAWVRSFFAEWDRKLEADLRALNAEMREAEEKHKAYLRDLDRYANTGQATQEFIEELRNSDSSGERIVAHIEQKYRGEQSCT